MIPIRSLPYVPAFSICVVAAAFLAGCAVDRSDPAGTSDAAAVRGTLVIAGGGEWPDGLAREFVELAAGHETGTIVVITTASGVPEETGPELVKRFTEAGAKQVACHHWTREEAVKAETAALLDGAGGVFFSGGVQDRITTAILGTPVHERLKAMFEAGAVIGGTSAGAAIMSEVMITGDERRTVEEGREWSTIEAGNVVTAPGLGFLSWGIVDQHFIIRKRQNRLLSLVAENPALLGVGIDESTAILAGPGGIFGVFGNGQVAVYDASRAEVRAGSEGPIAFRGLIMHLLKDGDVFDIAGRAVR